jgi:hypothetical protein
MACMQAAVWVPRPFACARASGKWTTYASVCGNGAAARLGVRRLPARARVVAWCLPFCAYGALAHSAELVAPSHTLGAIPVNRQPRLHGHKLRMGVAHFGGRVFAHLSLPFVQLRFSNDWCHLTHSSTQASALALPLAGIPLAHRGRHVQGWGEFVGLLA